MADETRHHQAQEGQQSPDEATAPQYVRFGGETAEAQEQREAASRPDDTLPTHEESGIAGSTGESWQAGRPQQQTEQRTE